MDADFCKDLLDSIAVGVYFVNLERCVTYWNKGAERITGYSAMEVLEKPCAETPLRHVDDQGTLLCEEGCPLAATMQDGLHREADVYLHHRFGYRVPITVRSTPIRDDTGAIIGAVEVFTDNTKFRDLLQELEITRQEVLTDPLTGVANRRYAEIIMADLDKAMRDNQVPFGILMADIDNFKQTNDTWGHSVGDTVLKMVARTLAAVSRRVDAVCRWGGEEFVVLIPNASIATLETVAERMRILVENSWLDHEGSKLAVTVSIGGALAAPGEPAHSVLDRADKQLYVCKDDHRNCVRIHIES